MANQLVIPINGRSGRFQINGVNLNVSEAHGQASTTLGEITGFENQAVDGTTVTQRTNGNLDCTVNLKGPVDTTLMPAAALIYPGATLTNVKIFLDKAIAGRCLQMSNAIVESVTFDVVEKEPATMYNAVVKASGGTLTQPT